MHKRKPSFRLIHCTSSDAATNMAIDEAILEAHLNSLVPPTLRIYQFTPPAVSFGYAQTIQDSVRDRILQAGFDVVRRPTGGRAVLHQGDLTYAFICSSNGATISEYSLVAESVATAYKQICQALIISLESFGITVTLGSSRNNYQDKEDCFLATTIGDLQYKNSKIVGSAQLRRKHALLQHGSIILNQPQTLMQELVNDTTSGSINHHANLYDAVKFEPSIASLEKELTKGFQKAFDCRFLPEELTTYELSLASRLKKKYSSLTDIVN